MRLAFWLLFWAMTPFAASAETLLPGGSFGATYIENPTGDAVSSVSLSTSTSETGFSLGIDHGLSRSGDGTMVFGSLDLSLRDVTLRLGKPRVALERPDLSDTILPILPLYPDDLRFGMQISGQQASYSYGASFHRTDGSTSVIGLRARYAGETLSVYGSALSSEDTDQVQLGTALNYGAATAGIDLAYRTEDDQQTQSRVFVDYDVTDALTLGVVGRRDGLRDAESDTSLGLSAKFDTGRGGFLRGGVAKSPDSDPLLGLSLGFRF